MSIPSASDDGDPPSRGEETAMYQELLTVMEAWSKWRRDFGKELPGPDHEAQADKVSEALDEMLDRIAGGATLMGEMLDRIADAIDAVPSQLDVRAQRLAEARAAVETLRTSPRRRCGAALPATSSCGAAFVDRAAKLCTRILKESDRWPRRGSARISQTQTTFRRRARWPCASSGR